MDSIINRIKKIVPYAVIRRMSGIIYGWHGNYSSWKEASLQCSGFDSPVILEKVKESALKVKEGKAAYERDSFLFDEIQYSFPLLSCLLSVAAHNKGKLDLLDFGGSLGSTYYQNKRFLDLLPELNWCIVEQPEFVREGRQNFADSRLHFCFSADECFNTFKINAILLSSVLQYLEDPYQLIDNFISASPEFIIIDRTPFINGGERLTIQKVNPKIYRASYPCWFFNKEKFLLRFRESYDLLIEFEALDKANTPSEFKGFLFMKKTVQNYDQSSLLKTR